LKIVLDKTIEDNFELLDKIDLVIPSPGIPGDFKLVEEAIRRSIDSIARSNWHGLLMSQSREKENNSCDWDKRKDNCCYFD
jgi:hypothetical protein